MKGRRWKWKNGGERKEVEVGGSGSGREVWKDGGGRKEVEERWWKKGGGIKEVEERRWKWEEVEVP